MKSFLEFNFPGMDLGGKCEREVSSRDLETVVSLANSQKGSIYCRFFDKNDENKENYSHRYWFGREYSCEEFKAKFPQLKDKDDFAKASRIVQARTGGFYPLSETDVVVSV